MLAQANQGPVALGHYGPDHTWVGRLDGDSETNPYSAEDSISGNFRDDLDFPLQVSLPKYKQITMSNLIVMFFADPEEAGAVRHTLSSIRSGGYIRLDDSVVVVKNANGKISVKKQMDRGVRVGSMNGGFLRFLLGGLFFPVAGILIGVLSGAAIGAAAKMGICQKFVKEVSESMEPTSSALFIIVRDANRMLPLRPSNLTKAKFYKQCFPPRLKRTCARYSRRNIRFFLMKWGTQEWVHPNLNTSVSPTG